MVAGSPPGAPRNRLLALKLIRSAGGNRCRRVTALTRNSRSQAQLLAVAAGVIGDPPVPAVGAGLDMTLSWCRFRCPAWPARYAGPTPRKMSATSREARTRGQPAGVCSVAMVEFLSLKELHHPPPALRGQISAQTRYLATNTNAAQRLRALGHVDATASARSICRSLPAARSVDRRPKWDPPVPPASNWNETAIAD